MSEREFSDPAIQTYLSGTDVVVLAMVTGNGGPLATPMWFVNDDSHLTMISVDGLAKIRHLEREPRVCVVAEGGVRGAINGLVLTGEVRFLDGDERSMWGRRFAERYSPDIQRLWGGTDIPDNRRVFTFEPTVVSDFGLG